MKKILLLASVLFAGAAIAQTYTFTSCGITGRTGPTQGDVNTAYAATNLNGMVTINTQGIQEWTVPATGNYSIEAHGASGGTHPTYAGRGANMYGEVNLTAGTTLYIIVGQMGSQNSSTNSDGGGGGSFIADGSGLLFVAGGGGGGAQNVNASQDASTTASVANGSASMFGSAGAGYSANGVHFTYSTYTTVAQSFLNGGAGQAGGQAGGWPGGTYGDGGFGGGGSACSCSTGGGGGGGGYVGGGGGGNGPYISGYGGSSYSVGSATNVTTSVLTGFGDGTVIITSLCAPTSVTPDLANLPDVNAECSASAPTAPTASTNCGGSVTGTTTTTFPITTPGTTVVTWTYDDGNGNTATQTQNVVIDDVTAPVPDAPALIDYSDCDQVTLPSPTATDNCSGAITGTPDVTFPVTTPGTTVVTWTFDDGNGNTSTQTQNVTINAIDTTVNQSGGQLNSVELVSAYQWLDCDNNYAVVPGAVNQFFTPPSSGSYAVEITKNGCVDTSSCHLVDFTSLNELDNYELSIYPNPTSEEEVHISYSGSVEMIKVIDITGREVINAEGSDVIDISDLVAGRYFVHIVTDKGLAVRQLIRY